MRRRIKPIVVVVFFTLIATLLIIGKAHSDNLKSKELKLAKASIPTNTSTSNKSTTSTSETTEFLLNPIIDVSGWQLPSDIDYDLLASNISAAIVRVYGGSQLLPIITLPLLPGLINHSKSTLQNFKNDISQLLSIAML